MSLDSQSPEIARVNFDIPRIEKEWLTFTELCKRALNHDDQLSQVENANSVAVIFRAFLSKVPNEELPGNFYKTLSEQDFASDPALQKAQSVINSLPNFLSIPPTPEAAYSYYGGLRNESSHLSKDVVDRILRRSRYARDVKLLALAAEMKVVDPATLEQDNEFTTPHGVKVKINPALHEERESIVDSSTWDVRRTIKDRVHLTIINGKEYILKERKSHRHSDVAGTANGKISLGNSSEQEFDLAMGITNQGTISHGDVIVSWERPIAWVQYPDAESTQFVLFEKIPDAVDIADYSSRKNSEKILADLTTQLAELIIKNEPMYSDEMHELCESAVERYSLIDYWDSEKYPMLLSQDYALEQNPDPESMEATESVLENMHISARQEWFSNLRDYWIESSYQEVIIMKTIMVQERNYLHLM